MSLYALESPLLHWWYVHHDRQWNKDSNADAGCGLYGGCNCTQQWTSFLWRPSERWPLPLTVLDF